MQSKATPQPEPGAGEGGAVVEREVETVRTRERVAGGAVDATMAGAPAERTVAPAAVAGARSGRYLDTLPERLSALALVVLTAVEGLLGTRFLLHAFGANPRNSFVGFVDDVSWGFTRPFANVFSNRSWDQGSIEFSTVVAMGVYFLVFALLGMLVTALAPRLSGQAGDAA